MVALSWIVLCLVSCDGCPAANRGEPGAVDFRGVAATSGSRTEGPDPVCETTERLIAAMTDRFRQTEGRRPLRRDSRLTAAARGFANFLAETGNSGHTADGRSPAERVRLRGYAYCLIAENLGAIECVRELDATELAAEFVDGWKHSPGHRENLLDPDVRETGVAVARRDQGPTYYAVQLFGKPEELAIKFEVVNRSNTALEYQCGGERLSLPVRSTRSHHQCRPCELHFTWPAGTQGPASLRPRPGDRLVITRNNSRFQIERE
jgi:uncharacterized protein YkwD